MHARIVQTGTWWRLLGIFVCLTSILAGPVNGDELILNESASQTQTVGDFGVSTFVSSVQLDQASMLDESGTITAGNLYTYFKGKGLTSVYDIKLCLDVDADLRADYALDSIELRIEDLDPNKRRQRHFSLGDNSLTIPGYENSASKPEAQFTASLGYDFMEEFNENSTEKLKFEYVSVDGQRNALPVKVGVLSPPPSEEWSSYLFLIAFSSFWLLVFVVLFRVTSPKSHSAAYPAA